MSKYQTFDAESQLAFMKEIAKAIDPDGNLELIPLVADEYEGKIEEMAANLANINHGEYIGHELYKNGLGGLDYYVLKFDNVNCPARCDIDPEKIRMNA